MLCLFMKSIVVVMSGSGSVCECAVVSRRERPVLCVAMVRPGIVGCRSGKLEEEMVAAMAMTAAMAVSVSSVLSKGE